MSTNNQKSPSKLDLSTLVKYYQQGRYDESEKLALSITQQFPSNQFSWKVLAAILLQTGRLSEALIANQKSVLLAPKDAEAYYNLGVNFQGLGKLEDAESSYRKAIEINFDYAEAYYNLGVTLQALRKLEEAESSYKQAIIIKPDYAEAYYNMGNIQKEVNRLEDAIESYRKAIAQNSNYAEAYSNLGITLYQLGRLEEAIISYKQAIVLRPNYTEVHTNLGVTLQDLNRLEEAEVSYRKAITLNPEHSVIHNNLGNILQKIGRLEEAEVSYRKAITLDPHYATAHYNFGVTLQDLNRLEEAEVSYRQAIALKSDYFESYSNLGVTQNAMGKLEEAEGSYRKAIQINSNYAEAHGNLGNTLQKIGKLEEAEVSYKRAIQINPNYAKVYWNLAIVYHFLNNNDDMILQLEKLIIIDNNNYGLRAKVNFAILKFLQNDFVKSKQYILTSSEIQNELNLKFKNEKVYHTFLLNLLSWHENNASVKYDKIFVKKLYVIGESHSLVSHGLYIKNLKGNFLCKAMLIMGCKQWHLGSANRNGFKVKFETIMHFIPVESEVLLSIGEIDCRLNSGIIQHCNNYPNKNIDELMSITIMSYLNYIHKINKTCKHNITIQGTPCPNIVTKNISKDQINELINLIREFNVLLKRKSIQMGFNFLDLYVFTDRGDGFSNAKWHSDDHHLTHEGMLEAWRINS